VCCPNSQVIRRSSVTGGNGYFGEGIDSGPSASPRPALTPAVKPVGVNMRIQLAYWSTDETAVYSQPKESGQLCLRLDKQRVGNTDYVYTGDATRRAKYDYSFEMVKGATSTASRKTKWFMK
jgi:hypothetical protein